MQELGQKQASKEENDRRTERINEKDEHADDDAGG